MNGVNIMVKNVTDTENMSPSRTWVNAKEGDILEVEITDGATGAVLLKKRFSLGGEAVERIEVGKS